MRKHYNLAVIGGGAAGFAAAITAAQKGAEVVLIEGNERMGRKLSVSGNGQGNIANAVVEKDNYNCILPIKVFEKVPYTKMENFLSLAGIATVQKERGRIYPLSMQASGIVDNLRLRANELNVSEINGFIVNRLTNSSGIFNIYSQSGDIITSDAVIVACGGRAHPDLSCGEGYNLLTSFGHRVTELLPVLVQLKTEKKKYLKYLKGIRLEDVNVKAVCGNNLLKQTTGDVIFTDYGISGSAVFEVSGSAVLNIHNGKNVDIVIDMFSNIGIEELQSILTQRKILLGNRKAEHFFTGFISKQLGKAVSEYTEINTQKLTADITDAEIKNIAHALKNFSLSVRGNLGFKYAQVTAGGIETEGFDENLMSKYCKNLYACGEILNVHGDCGGYNLLWAFSGGILCGEDAAKRLGKL